MSNKDPRWWKMVDIVMPQDVSVVISSDAQTLWVNVDGKCALRCQRIRHLGIDDMRQAKRKT